MTKRNEKAISAKKPKQKTVLAGFLFTMPVILGIIIFTYIPLIEAFYYSFCKYDGFSKLEFIGFKNYVDMFTTDIETLTVFKNTFIYAAITVPLTMVLSYIVALLVNVNIKGISVFRLLIYLPVLIPGVSAGVIWKDIMDPVSGIMSQIFNTLFGVSPMFLSKAETALPSLIWIGTWGLGGNMIMWLAAFKNIPTSLYESAKLDGANAVVRVFKITIPMSTSMIFYNLVVGVIGSLQVFSTFVIAGATNGRGPSDSLYFIAVKIYDEAFTRIGRMGYACAYSFVLFAIIGVLTAFTFKTNGWVNYAEDM